jgi:hypothetical protein
MHRTQIGARALDGCLSCLVTPPAVVLSCFLGGASQRARRERERGELRQGQATQGVSMGTRCDGRYVQSASVSQLVRLGSCGGVAREQKSSPLFKFVCSSGRPGN